MNAQDLYYEYMDNPASYTGYRLAALKSRITRLSNRMNEDDASAHYLKLLAGDLGMTLSFTLAPPKPLMIPIYKVQLIRDSGQPADHTLISSPSYADAILRPYLAGADREHFVILMLDTKTRVIGINTVSIGTLNSTLISAREVFKPAILANAASIILAHNHPSGDPTPSREDVVLTQSLIEAGKILDIDVLDHVILGDHQFVSLKERGLI